MVQCITLFIVRYTTGRCVLVGCQGCLWSMLHDAFPFDCAVMHKGGKWLPWLHCYREQNLSVPLYPGGRERSSENGQFKVSPSTAKEMVVTFWDSQGLLLVEFMKCQTAVTAEACCATVWGLWEAIHRKWPRLLCKPVVLLQVSACTPHSATDCSLVAAVWMGVFWTSAIQSWLGTESVSSFWSSEEASW
jgi:hypothetical protein